MVREHVQGNIQRLLEEDVEDFLGRSRYERKSAVDPQAGYRNGHGRPRRLTLSCGTIELRRPRVRTLDERLESQLLPFFQRRTREVNALLPELYLARQRRPSRHSARPSASTAWPRGTWTWR